MEIIENPGPRTDYYIIMYTMIRLKVHEILVNPTVKSTEI